MSITETLESSVCEDETMSPVTELISIPATPNFCPECGTSFVYEVVDKIEDQEDTIDAGRPLLIEIDKTEHGLSMFRFRASANGEVMCHSQSYVEDRQPSKTIKSIIEDIRTGNYMIKDLRKK
jgi:uncharacterized protein YegP (UPF0339 family)